MQDRPLLVSSLIEHAERYHGDTEIVVRADGGIHRTNWREVGGRARRLANALRALGVRAGDRVATLALNTHRHLELYYAVSGMGAVLHTVNPRLFPQQIRYLIEHAEDRLVFFDPQFGGLLAGLGRLPASVRALVALCGDSGLRSGAMPDGALCYEPLLEHRAPDYEWPQLDEKTASSLCYTSGTTGEPKGVLYSHRSTVLHTLALCAPDCVGLSSDETVLLVVPLFHVNGWGVPYAAAASGAKLVLPGADLDGASLWSLLAEEACTLTLGVPTVWAGLLEHVETLGAGTARERSALRRVFVGGSAVPRSMIERFEALLGAAVVHSWGMTEMSPMGVIGKLLPRHAALSPEAAMKLRLKQGRAVYGVELRLVGDDGAEVPRDGASPGELLVRGPWIASAYYRRPGMDAAFRSDGWFATGDVATLDPDGYLHIVDRSKDVIKSGGEWISSIEIENAALGHPAIREAAVIGLPHPKWQERPLLVAVLRPGASATRAEILEFLARRMAKWWLPDDVVFTGEIPHTATGKIAKRVLRERFRNHALPGVPGPRA